MESHRWIKFLFTSLVIVCAGISLSLTMYNGKIASEVTLAGCVEFLESCSLVVFGIALFCFHYRRVDQARLAGKLLLSFAAFLALYYFVVASDSTRLFSFGKGAVPAKSYLITAAVLMMDAMALLALSRARFGSGIMLGIWISLLVCGLGTLIISGLTQMLSIQFDETTLVTLVASHLGGIVILFHSCTDKFLRIAMFRSLPVLVGFNGLMLTLLLWHALNTDQKQRLQRTVQFETAFVDHTLQDQFQKIFGNMQEFAVRDGAANENRERWKNDIDIYAGSFPSCLGIGRLAHNNIQWLVQTHQMDLPTTSLRTGALPALSSSAVKNQPFLVLAPRSYWNGKRVLMAYFPVADRSDSPSGLIMVWNAQELFGSMLNFNLAAGYAIELSVGDDIIFQRSHNRSSEHRDNEQTSKVNIQNLKAHLRVTPTAEVLARESLLMPKLALAAGFLMTILLAVAVKLAQTARTRADALEREITERKLVEARRKDIESKYRLLLDSLEQGVFLTDGTGRVLAANSGFCSYFCLNQNDVIGKKLGNLLPNQALLEWEKDEELVISAGHRIEHEHELDHLGSKRRVRRILNPLRQDGSTVGMLGICWDVTEQRLLEARVNQAGKMDAIGQLAGGIAHDFNNLLTAILGNLDLLQTSLPTQNRCYDLVLSAQNAASRAANLTNQLLGFSRQHDLDWAPMNIDKIVAEVAHLLERTIDPRIRIETNIAESIWPVYADATQINQVIMNLCLNARDALGERGGQIKIDVSNQKRLPGAQTPPIHAHAGEFVRLVVADNGCGMTSEVKARIFEPFFTTKEVGKGTGLGLAMVFAIVKRHNGWIECDSSLGRGTSFTIYLPRCHQSSTIPVVTPPPLIECPRGGETILVVDDEPMIRKLAALVLQRAGFTVREAEDGLQAVTIYEQAKDEIDLVLLDLTMPNLSGKEAFLRMLKINPSLKVMFASGYAEEELSVEDKEHILGFIKKPYRPDVLLQAIRDVFDTGPESENKDDCDPIGCGVSSDPML